MKKLILILLGFYFGFILIKSEAVSWYRIVEMFQFQSFHLFGVIGSAVSVGVLSILLLKSLKVKSIDNEELDVSKKKLLPKSNILGGVMFGAGWALVGACPAPLFIHLGLGNWIILIPILSAILGVFIYGITKKYLPH